MCLKQYYNNNNVIRGTFLVIKLHMIFKFGAIKNGLFGPTWSYHTWFSLIEILLFPVVFKWGISINHHSAFFHSVYCTSIWRYPVSQSWWNFAAVRLPTHWKWIIQVVSKNIYLVMLVIQNNWHFSQEKRLQYVHHIILNLWPVWPLQTLINLTLYMLRDLFIHIRLMMYRNQNV
jgi:hypothetical protein